MTTDAAAYRTPSDRDATPPLDAFHAAYSEDDNEWWVIACGHHQNLYEEAMDRIEMARRLRDHHLRGTPEVVRDKCQCVGCEMGRILDGVTPLSAEAQRVSDA